MTTQTIRQIIARSGLDAYNEEISAACDAIDARISALEQQGEPFGYFRVEPFGWADCAETDEGAIALYEHPAADLTDELVSALENCVDAVWHIDSHSVQFDGTVMFSEFYDFSGLDGYEREEFLAEYECVVWPSGGKWSAYCTYEGSTWFERFDNASDAKEQCMKLLDRILPDHPAMKARAIIAKVKGVE